MASSSVSPCVCSVSEMFSYSSASFSDSNWYRKFCLFMALEVRPNELEARFCSSELSKALLASQDKVDAAEQLRAGTASCP